MYKIKLAGTTQIGSVRQENQDAIVIDGCILVNSGAKRFVEMQTEAPFIVSVIDGMGGYKVGKDAAGLTALKLAGVRSVLPEPGWQDLCAEVSQQIGAAGQAWGAPDMGAVFATLCFTPEGIYSVNVGDCKAYRAFGDYFVRLSVDDKSASGNGLLTQALSRQFPRPAAHYNFYPYGDIRERFLVCSDGLTESLGEATLKEWISTDYDIFTIHENLIRLAYESQPQDNFTFAVAEVNLGE
jgi:protein phosphatase